MILGSYYNGFAPRDGLPLYPSLWQGCVGAWAPCLGATGLTLRDWSGFRNHGTLNNMTADSDWIVSQGRHALDFDGVDDEVAIPDAPQLRVQSYTISCFVTARSNTAGYFFFKQNSRSTVFEAFSLVNDSGILATVQSSSGGTQAVITVARNLNQRYHLAATFSKPTLTLFLDGVQVGTATHNFDVDHSANTLNFGRTTASANRFPANVILDDCRLYSRALAPQEIRLLASRRGIAYDLAPFRMPYSEQVATAARLRRLLLLGVGS